MTEDISRLSITLIINTDGGFGQKFMVFNSRYVIIGLKQNIKLWKKVLFKF